VGDHTVEVRAIVRSTIIIISVDGEHDLTISDNESVEILPNVRVFAGVGRGGTGNRLAFDAPKEVKIHRLGGESDEVLDVLAGTKSNASLQNISR
jgi:sRNA-binding carbon storage regulator CsrA